MSTTTFKPVSAADLKPNTTKEIVVDGRSVLLANVDGTYFAISNKCSHRGCALSKGKLDGDTIKCGCHGSVFSLKTGAILHGPAKLALPTFETKVENQNIYLNI
jgi:nitrite reductase/ring-hydroxylating ferredoxin subunit